MSEDDDDARSNSNAGNDLNNGNDVPPPPLSVASDASVAANFPLQGPTNQARRTVIVAPGIGGPNDDGNNTTRKLTGILDEKMMTLMISTNSHARFYL
jgi:N-acetylmuramoyl-L-alanine amidase